MVYNILFNRYDLEDLFDLDLKETLYFFKNDLNLLKSFNFF